MILKNIHATQKEQTILGDGLDVSTIIRDVVNQQSGRYHSFFTLFGAGFRQTTLHMYKWLLYPVLTSSTEALEAGLQYKTICEVLWTHHPEGKALNLGNLTQALHSTASLQVSKDIKPIVLDYDETNRKLNIVDRAFLIWVASQDRADLLSVAQLPNV